MSKGWHILHNAAGLTLARHLPARFDVQAQTVLPWGAPARYAHQIRQDLWRLLQNLRGFSPVIRLVSTAQGWAVTAGGRVLHPSGTIAPKICALLNDPGRRARWIMHAQRGGCAP